MGCATRPLAPLSSQHPASASAQEAPKSKLPSLEMDPVSLTSVQQLESKPSVAPTKGNMEGMAGMDGGAKSMKDMEMGKAKSGTESGKKANEMEGMTGMDHGQMSAEGQSQNKLPRGMDHSGMAGMNKDQTKTQSSKMKNGVAIEQKEIDPSEKKKLIEEMRKLSDEMKRTSDAFKATSDKNGSNETNK